MSRINIEHTFEYINRGMSINGLPMKNKAFDLYWQGVTSHDIEIGTKIFEAHDQKQKEVISLFSDLVLSDSNNPVRMQLQESDFTFDAIQNTNTGGNALLAKSIYEGHYIYIEKRLSWANGMCEIRLSNNYSIYCLNGFAIEIEAGDNDEDMINIRELKLEAKKILIAAIMLSENGLWREST